MNTADRQLSKETSARDSSRTRRALIIGSQGQDGQLLRTHLSRLGYSVTGLSRQAVEHPDGSFGAPVPVTDSDAVSALVVRLEPHEIYYLAAYHQASQKQPDESDTLWAASLAVNVTGPICFLDAMRFHAPESRFFYAGSCLAFGKPEQTPQTEGTCFRPDSAYGISKAAGYQAVRLYRESHNMFSVTGILYNHESSLRPEEFLSRKIIRTVCQIQRGLTHELVLGDLTAQSDWGYAPDFVDAFRRTLQVDEPTDYIIATGEAHSVLDWVEQAFALAGLPWRSYVKEDPMILRHRRPPLLGDPTRIRTLCKWTPDTSFERMVELLYFQEQAILSGAPPKTSLSF